MTGLWVGSPSLLETARAVADPRGEAITLLDWGEEGEPRVGHVTNLLQAAMAEGPTAILLPASVAGTQVASSLAQLLGCPMVSDCLSLRYVGEEDCLEVERFLYGGAAVAIIRCKTWPIVVTVAAGSEAETSSPETPLSYVTKSISWSPEAVEVLERKGKIGAKRPLQRPRLSWG